MFPVLILSQDPTELNTITSLIRRENNDFQVAGTFSDSGKALPFLAKNPADLLILDIHCPPGDGITLLQEIRILNPQIRCIFIASPGDCVLVQKAIPMGIENFLLKPVDPALLSDTLRSTAHKLHQASLKSPDVPISEPNILKHEIFEQRLLNQEYRVCLDELDKLFSDATVCPEITSSILRNYVVELVVCAINVMRSYNIDVSKLIGDSAALFYEILNFRDMSELYCWVRNFLSAAIEALENKNLRFSPCIARAVAHIEKHYAQDISLKTMAYKLNINAAYLGQLFKSETGQLFSAFLNNTRIENAQRLLLTTNLSLNDVAQQCGYTNISYFYNIFKKHTGKTPSQFRKTQA